MVCSTQSIMIRNRIPYYLPFCFSSLGKTCWERWSGAYGTHSANSAAAIHSAAEFPSPRHLPLPTTNCKMNCEQRTESRTENSLFCAHRGNGSPLRSWLIESSFVSAANGMVPKKDLEIVKLEGHLRISVAPFSTWKAQSQGNKWTNVRAHSVLCWEFSHSAQFTTVYDTAWCLDFQAILVTASFSFWLHKLP